MKSTQRPNLKLKDQKPNSETLSDNNEELAFPAPTEAGKKKLEPVAARRFEADNEDSELPPETCQHIKVVDCDKPVSRVFCECYHCLQGLLIECTNGQPVQQLEPRCPQCGRRAIRLMTYQVISVTKIPSPWQPTNE